MAVVIYRWHEIEKHLRESIDAAVTEMESAKTDREMWRAQGKAQALRALLNLPNILTVLRGE